jgi:hypothetical protein
MKRLTAVIEDYLGTASERPKVVLGSKAKEAEPAAATAPDAKHLISSLAKQAAFNNRILMTVIGSYLAVLIVAMVLVIRHQDDTKWVLGFLGGNFLVLLGVGSRILDLWREKNYMDMMLAVLPSLSSAEAIKFIRAFYMEKLASKIQRSKPARVPQNAAEPGP